MGILFGASGCLLVRAGITKLSELKIDTDKDWLAYGITNLKELAVGMARGDVLVYNGSILAKVSPGSVGHEFASSGPGQVPVWEAPPAP